MLLTGGSPFVSLSFWGPKVRSASKDCVVELWGRSGGASSAARQTNAGLRRAVFRDRLSRMRSPFAPLPLLLRFVELPRRLPAGRPLNVLCGAAGRRPVLFFVVDDLTLFLSFRIDAP